MLTRSAAPPTRTVRYGEGPDHVADVWLPESLDRSSPMPLVIVIHGGFWRAGYGRSIAAPISVALRDVGYAVAAVEYRRTGAGGGWPATTDDIRAAVETVPRLLSDRAAGPTVLVGHSAGGHLALWAASQAAVPRLGGVVSLGGVCDLVRADELALDRDGDDGAVATLLGGRSADVPERYAAADPMQLPAPSVPVALVHGLDDRIVPVELSRRYAAYARAAGADVRLVELPGAAHFGPIDPLSAAWPAVRTAVAAMAGRRSPPSH